MLQITSKHAPPFTANPQMVEWAMHASNHMCKGTEAKLAKEGQEACKSDYKRFLTTAQIQHNNDCEQVHNAYNQELNADREAYKAQTAQENEANTAKLAQFKADTKATLQQKMAEYEHDNVIVCQYMKCS